MKKKQHFIPKFYLKQWITKEKDELLNIRYKKNNNINRKAPKSICYIENLYETKVYSVEEKPEINLIENILSRAENKFSLMINEFNKIILENIPDLKDKVKVNEKEFSYKILEEIESETEYFKIKNLKIIYDSKKIYPILNFCIFYISSYIVMQFFRQKSTFASTKDGAELYIEELKKSQVKYQFNENAEHQFINEILLSEINTRMCWKIFENYDFNFLYNEEGRFYTSDSPVYSKNKTNLVLNEKIYFPLNPYILVNLRKRKNNERKVKFLYIEKKYLKKYNDFQCNQAEEIVIL